MDRFLFSPRKAARFVILPLALCFVDGAHAQETLPPDRTPPPRLSRPPRNPTGVPMTDETALSQAISSGDIEQVKALLEKMPNRLKSRTERSSVLSYAIGTREREDEKRLAMLEFLLNTGADPDFNGPNFTYTPLIDAIRNPRPATVALLLKKGANPDFPDREGFTPLQHGFLREDFEIVKIILNAGVDLKRWNSRGLTPLHVAASMANGDTSIVELMLQKGADVSTPTREGTEEISDRLSPPGLQPLHLAAAAGNMPVIQLLLKSGAKIDALSNAGETPLHIAAQNANLAVPVLLQAGADASRKTARGDTALHLMLRPPASGGLADPFASPTRKEALTALIAKSDVNARGQQGLTPLLMALQAKDQIARDLLIAAKGNADNTSEVFDAAAQNDAAGLSKLLKAQPLLASTVLPTGWTPLHMAALWNAPATMTALLAAGADVSARDSQGASPLHRVLQADKTSAELRANAILLIEKGADVNARSDYEPYSSRNNRWKEHMGDTPLNRAILLSDADLVSLLLKKGARLNSRNEHRDTPLMIAVKASKAEMIALFLQAGADIEETDEVEYSPLDRALQNGNDEVAKLLIAKGADVNHRSSSNGTPLMIATRQGSLELVELLIAKGADVNVKDDRGKTALTANGRQTTDEIRELLKKHGATE